MAAIADRNDKKPPPGTLGGDDGSVFDSIYREYYSRLVNYADRIVHDRQTAESIVQSVFLKIWDQKTSLTIDTSLSAYLFRAVYNKSINSVEHRRITERLLDERTREFYFTTVVQSPEAEQLMSDREINDAIEKAVAGLPEKCREIFVLSKMRGYRNRQIAEELNISEKTVEAQMSIALRKLRAELQWLLCIIFFV